MVPSPCPPCQVLESDTTAVAREILEAVHANNNDNALMVNSSKGQFYSPPVLLPLLRKAPKNPSSIHLFLIALRIYVYVSVCDSSKDPTLYISLGLLRHLLYTTLNLIAHRYHDSKHSRCHQVISRKLRLFPLNLRHCPERTF
jgi:hypothetical protein